jgi:isochorismate pyruvate lyase
MKPASECTSIDDVRSSIDELDGQIISLLGERFRYVKSIVQFKEKTKNSIVAKERFEAVIRSRRDMAKKNGLDADVIEKMYRILIQYFIEEEMNIINGEKN